MTFVLFPKDRKESLDLFYVSFFCKCKNKTTRSKGRMGDKKKKIQTLKIELFPLRFKG